MPNLLILVPTTTERQILEPLLQPHIQQAGGTLHLCGFGPVAAAARTSQLIARHRPDRIVLVGIAGAIGETLPVGTATVFDEVACFGVGVGTGDDFETGSRHGWQQWDSGDDAATEPQTVIGDVLPLRSTRGESDAEQTGEIRQLLTCCSASASGDDVGLRLRLFPNAIAEDMEGFGVAMAASLVGIPVQVVRGISNLAGDRDKARWRIGEALKAAAQLAGELIADSTPAS
jgi:futalosine hydrolase